MSLFARQGASLIEEGNHLPDGVTRSQLVWRRETREQDVMLDMDFAGCILSIPTSVIERLRDAQQAIDVAPVAPLTDRARKSPNT